MRVMIFVKASEASENGELPSTEAFEAFDRYNEELVNAGIFIAGAGLKPMSQSKRVAFDGASRSIIDGPFAETRELVAGFSIWEVKDMDEALAWVMRSPFVMPGKNEVEIRPFLEAEDLAGVLPPEAADAAPRGGDRLKLGVA